jgi:hypothetical protein
MAARFTESLCRRVGRFLPSRAFASALALSLSLCGITAQALSAQTLIKPAQPGEPITLLPSDMAALEADVARKDLPCIVVPRKADIGFDLRFHTGYDVTIPLRDLEGSEDMLTVLFRIYPQDDKSHSVYFTQHIRVPSIEQDAKGDAILQGGLDLGEGKYHVDWLMRDRAERICSSSWDVEAAIPPKDKPMLLFIGAGEIAQAIAEPFSEESLIRRQPAQDFNITVKLLVNFAPQDKDSPALQRIDTDALVSILKSIERDPHIGHVSLVAFNMQEQRIVYRQESADSIDLESLGKALQTMKLGTVNLQQLGQKHGETDFLEDLIEKEVGNSIRPDAVIFAGPKAMLNADVPQQDLRRIGEIECPVFYMNYNPNPQAVPWRDSISHAIRAFKGTEYTISRPRDLWFSTSEMVTRIVRAKRQRVISAVAGARTP